jgi:hypothetical protein
MTLVVLSYEGNIVSYITVYLYWIFSFLCEMKMIIKSIDSTKQLLYIIACVCNLLKEGPVEACIISHRSINPLKIDGLTL